nr:DUF1700 domain-containing protein [uncultured Agathobaculum sp.]
MNRSEYMAALRHALSALPEEEQANALRYYEEYFDDAGPAGEQQAIDGLGAPEKVAAQILADYREVSAAPQQAAGGAQSGAPGRTRGISPGLLIVLALLAIPVAIPLAGILIGAIATVFGLLVAAAAVVFCLTVVVPLALTISGLVLCGFSFALWGAPASALVTCGCGLALFALGILLCVLMVRLCMLAVPPLFRGLAALIRWPFDKLCGRARRGGGEAS